MTDDADHTSYITGTTNFYELRCWTTAGTGFTTGKSIIFDHSGKQTIAQLDIRGTGDYVISIDSDEARSAAEIAVTSAYVDYAAVRYSNNTGTAINPTHTTNRGNNTGWTFMTRDWTGRMSNDWNDARNWDGAVPSDWDDVYLVSGETPTLGTMLDGRSYYCNNLTLEDGAQLNLNGYSLSIRGGLESEGTIRNNASADITITADNIHGGTITNSGTLAITASGVHGDIGNTTSSGYYLTVNGASLINLTPAGDGEIALAGTTLNVGAVEATGIVTLDGNVVVKGSFDPNGYTVYVTKGWKTAEGGSFVYGESTVEFTSLNDATIEENNTFYNFTSTVTGKKLCFQFLKTQTIMGRLTLRGVELRSTAENRLWYISPVVSNRDISGIYVKDSVNHGSGYLIPHTDTTNTNGGNTQGWFQPAPGETEEPAKDWVPQIYIVNPWATMLNMSTLGGDISMGDDIIGGGSGKKSDKYAKNYAKGKYKTVVIVFEGKVMVSAYDKSGPKLKQGKAVSGGQQAVQKGEIK
jgi:hypothetical protein